MEDEGGCGCGWRLYRYLIISRSFSFFRGEITRPVIATCI